MAQSSTFSTYLPVYFLFRTIGGTAGADRSGPGQIYLEECVPAWSDRDGTAHVVFDPLEFMAKLAALVPRSHTNLTRFDGVLAPNSRYRDRVTPIRCGKFKKLSADGNTEADGLEEPVLSKRKGMCLAQRLTRVFNIDVSICSACGGPMRIIAESRTKASKIRS